ncbi:MAG: hypothetical protein R2909_00450 [Gemmatimonadales bacterium]
MADPIASSVTADHVDAYHRDGVVVLRGAFAAWIPTLAKGADFNAAHPSDRALVRAKDGGGHFLEDFCSWQRIAEYRTFVESPMAAIAAALDALRHRPVLPRSLPRQGGEQCRRHAWHQDIPYCGVRWRPDLSFWIPLERRERPRSVASPAHRWPKEVRPTSWSTNELLRGRRQLHGPARRRERRLRDQSVGDQVATAFQLQAVHGAAVTRASWQADALLSPRW